MKLQRKILEKIVNDNELSLRLALAMNKTQQSIRLRAMRDSESLCNEKAVEIYRRFGFSKIYRDE